MKKGSSFLMKLITFSISICIVLLTYVFVLEEVKELSFFKKESTDKLIQLSNSIESSLVEKEKLESEDRISRIAINELGLTFSDKKLTVLKLNKEDIHELRNYLDGQYE